MPIFPPAPTRAICPLLSDSDRRTAVEREPRLLLRKALRAKLPWTVIVGSDATRAYKPTPEAYRNMAWILRLAPGEVMLAAAHNRDLTFAQRAGLGTAFIPRPTDH